MGINEEADCRTQVFFMPLKELPILHDPDYEEADPKIRI